MKYKYSNSRKFLLSILTFILLMSLNDISFAEEQLDDGKMLPNPPYGFADDPSNIIYSNTGVLLSGPNIIDEVEKEGKQLLPITYQGEKTRFVDMEIAQKIYDKVYIEEPNTSKKNPLSLSTTFSVNLSKGDILYVDDFGVYNGKNLRLKIYSDYDAIVNISTGNAVLSVNTKGSPYGLSDFYYIIEDKDGNIINDPEYLLLMGGVFGAQDRYTYDSQNNSRPTNISYANYILSGSPISNMITNQTDANYLNTASLNVNDNQQRKISEKVRSYTFYPNNGPGALANSKFSSFIQLNGNPTHVIRNLYASNGARFTKEPFLDYIGGGAYFGLFGENSLPVRIPYGFPIIWETTNNKTDISNRFKVNLDVSQTLPVQSNPELYPELLRLTVNLKDQGNLIDHTKLDSSKFKLILDGTDITNRAKFSISQTDPTKLIIDLDKKNLEAIGGSVVHIEGALDVKHEDESLYDSIDSEGYILINELKAKNNINVREYTSGTLKSKVPGPEADPVPTAVIEGQSTDDLDSSNLVKNLQSLLPNDSVIIEGFKETKVFATPGKTDVEVLLRSKRVPNATTTIVVPIEVFPKNSPQLSELNIIPEKDKVVHTKDELTYNPTYIQNLKSTNNSEDSLNNVLIKFKYDEGLLVTNQDFVLTDSKGNKIASNLYNLKVNGISKEVEVNIPKNALANELKNEEINIQQHSKLNTSDKNIMSSYDKNSKIFNFDISGYNSWNLKDSDPYISTKVIKAVQKISYEPNISADPVLNTSVNTGDEVKEAKEYVKNVSKPDFDFDTYEIEFKEKPEFSSAGNKDFSVIVKSKSFDTFIEVPVTVLVVDPSVKTTVNYYQWLNNDVSDDRIVDNLLDGTRKKESIETVDIEDKSIEQLLKDNKKLQAPIVSGYTFDSKDSSKLKVTLDSDPNTPISLSEKMPKENFTINYYYEPTIELNVPTDINFGVRKNNDNLNIYGMVPQETDTNNSISIINTYETAAKKTNWTLYASTEGFFNENTGVRLLADVLLKTPDFSEPKEITNESTPLLVNNNEFKKNISLIDEKQEEGLFVRVGKVNNLGKYNGVLKYKLQAAP